ncbi:glutathionylspermidine synthase family protein [Escherichia coli]
MDFAWCGNAPVKLLEYNADTPTSLMSRLISSGCGWRMPGEALQYYSA